MRTLVPLLAGLAVSGCSCASAVERPADGGTDAVVADGGSDAAQDAARAVDTGTDTGTDAGTDAATRCSGTIDCDDGDPCNGTETCAAGFCVAGSDRLADGAVCRTGGKGATCLAGRCVPNP